MLVSKDQAISDLAAIIGKERVLTDEQTLKEAEGLNRSYAKAFGIYANPLPICVLKINNVQDLSKVLKYCNDNLINVIPRTGASSGEGLLEVINDETIVIDASEMDQLINFDEENMQVTVGCGMPLERLETFLNERGYTTGHAPQSLPFAQLGGLVATRSIGQFSTYYGGIEDLVVGLEAVLTDGTVVRIRNVPRRAAGPDLRHLFIGSEGCLAFITEVTLKIFKYYPDSLWKGGYIVEDMDTGFRAIREIMAAGYKPSVVRLYDKPDMDYNFGSVELKDEEAFMAFVAEGPPALAKATGEAIHEISLSHGGRYIGTKALDHWLEHRNDVCKLVHSEKLKQRYRELNIYYATTEISACWRDIREIYKAVKENVPPQIDNLVMLGGHVSHCYINGTNIYFVYQIKIKDPHTANQEHLQVVRAICTEVLKFETGGCVHHHGVGKHRVSFMRQEHGSSYVLMERLKKALDPNGIMNKGALFIPD